MMNDPASHRIQIVVANGHIYFRPYSLRHAHSRDTVEWHCSDQFYLKFEDRAPFRPDDPLIESTQSTPGNWIAGPLTIEAEPDRYAYQGTVLWADPSREDGKIEPIHHNSPDIIVEL